MPHQTTLCVFHSVILSRRKLRSNGKRPAIAVGFDDLVTLARHYGMSADYSGGDVDGSGTVGFDDLLLLARNYGLSANIAAAAAVAVPEPCIAAFALIALALTRKRDANRPPEPPTRLH